MRIVPVGFAVSPRDVYRVRVKAPRLNEVSGEFVHSPGSVAVGLAAAGPDQALGIGVGVVLAILLLCSNSATTAAIAVQAVEAEQALGQIERRRGGVLVPDSKADVPPGGGIGDLGCRKSNTLS